MQHESPVIHVLFVESIRVRTWTGHYHLPGCACFPSRYVKSQRDIGDKFQHLGFHSSSGTVMNDGNDVE
jgi:hypothetical protein